MKKFDQINVIPMIDVMLVLLAIVLTTASFIVHDALNINLPQTHQTQSAPTNNKAAVTLAINAQNQLFFNETPVDLTTLTQKLASLSPQQPIELKVDQKARFGRFTEIIDQLKAHHLNQLTILTQHR